MNKFITSLFLILSISITNAEKFVDVEAKPNHKYWLLEGGNTISNSVQNLDDENSTIRIFYDDSVNENNVSVVEEEIIQTIPELEGGWDGISKYPVMTGHHTHADLYEIANFELDGDFPGNDLVRDNSIVRVSNGKSLTISNPTKLHGLAVRGKLIVNSDLLLETIIVYPDGELIVNPGATIGFYGDIKLDPSQSALGIFSMGTINVNGSLKENLLFFNKISNTELSCNDISNWSVGDTVVFPDAQRVFDSAYQIRTFRRYQSQQEVRTIVKIVGNKIVLNEALKYNHFDENSQIPVGNASSDITFYTADGSPRRAHSLFTGTNPVQIQGASFVNMGRTDTSDITPAGGSNQIGRYPLHAHHSTNFVFTDCVVLGGLRHGIVHHNSHGIVMDSFVAGAPASGIFSEEGGETGVWDNNVVFSDCYNSPLLEDDSKFSSHSGKELGGGGFSYWLRTLNVEVKNNRAYGFSLFAYATFNHGLFNKEEKVVNFAFPFFDNYFYGSASSALRMAYNTRTHTIRNFVSYNQMANADGFSSIHSGNFVFEDCKFNATNNGRTGFVNINGLSTRTITLKNNALNGFRGLSYRYVVN